MTEYVAKNSLGKALGRELQKVQSALDTMQVGYVEFKVHNVAPDKPRIGRVYYADGTNWNPGSGEGLYVYKTSYVFIA